MHQRETERHREEGRGREKKTQEGGEADRRSCTKDRERQRERRGGAERRRLRKGGEADRRSCTRERERERER